MNPDDGHRRPTGRSQDRVSGRPSVSSGLHALASSTDSDAAQLLSGYRDDANALQPQACPHVDPVAFHAGGTTAACAADGPDVGAKPIDDSMSAKRIVRRTVWAGILLLVVSLLASWLARDWLTVAGTYLIGEFGGRGVFTSVFFIDWIPIPATPEPIFLLGISAGMDMKDLFISASSGGVVAALGCYASGAVLERTTPIGDWVKRKYPSLVEWVETHGYKGLALAAIIPLPFSPMMWIAGIIGMPLERVVAISLLRIVKTAFYLYIIALGWSLT